MARVTNNNIKEFQDKMLGWYDANGRKFLWRSPGLSSYELVIAEVLLQRTKAETVSRVYISFLMHYPNWQSLSDTNIEELENILKPIGLYRQRASRLKKLAIEMVQRGGEFPKERKQLESIPFLGQYIANAVELLVHKIPSPLIDVNMARVLERYFKPRQLADIRYDLQLQSLAGKIVESCRSAEISWAILDFAALICKARKPLCAACILNKKCTYYNKYLS